MAGWGFNPQENAAFSRRTPVADALRQAWLDLDVVQCGYCQSGQLMSAAALLKENPHPTDADIDSAMSGNLCRCGSYPRVRAAIHQAAQSTTSGRFQSTTSD